MTRAVISDRALKLSMADSALQGALLAVSRWESRVAAAQQALAEAERGLALAHAQRDEAAAILATHLSPSPSPLFYRP